MDIRKLFFAERVAKHWNRLPREMVDAPDLSVFKGHLDNALNNMVLLLIGPEAVRVGLDDSCRSLPIEISHSNPHSRTECSAIMSSILFCIY